MKRIYLATTRFDSTLVSSRSVSYFIFSLNFSTSYLVNKNSIAHEPVVVSRRICCAMSLSKSVPLDATTRSPMNRPVPASKLFYHRLISVIFALLLKPKHQRSRIPSCLNLTRSSTTSNENMEYRSCQ